MKINVHSLLSIHSLLPCLRLLVPEMNFTLNAPPMGIKSLIYTIIQQITPNFTLPKFYRIGPLSLSRRTNDHFILLLGSAANYSYSFTIIKKKNSYYRCCRVLVPQREVLKIFFFSLSKDSF